jgi:Cu2+-exporting ATPase
VEVSPGASRAECLSLAAALEQGSTHPIANALRAACATTAYARDVASIPGRGVEGIVGGRRYRCGRPGWVGELHGRPLAVDAASDGACAALGDESGWLARFTFADSPKAGAAELVDALATMGIGVSLVSGDRPAQVVRLAESLGIADWHAAALPRDKCAHVAALQRSGEVVAMVGDGINDAASLAQADVSLSFGCAAPLAQWTADIVLLGDDLDDIRVAIGAARKTFRVIRQNFGWAIAYNALAIPLAATGQLTPLAAAAGMSLSSMLVVANALRLSRIDRGGRATERRNDAAAHGA